MEKYEYRNTGNHSSRYFLSYLPYHIEARKQKIIFYEKTCMPDMRI